jgi:hypothetical protein
MAEKLVVTEVIETIFKEVSGDEEVSGDGESEQEGEEKEDDDVLLDPSIDGIVLLDPSIEGRSDAMVEGNPSSPK